MGELESLLILRLFSRPIFSQPIVETLLTPTETAVLWGLHHPYWLGAIAVSLIFLIQLLLSGVIQFLRHSIRWVGQSPLFLSRWLLSKTSPSRSSHDLNNQTLTTLLVRLETLQQEQIDLLAELRTILATKEPGDFS